MSRADQTFALQCKVELTDWGETATDGCTITFRLADAASLNAIKTAFLRKRNGDSPHYLLHLLKVAKCRRTVDPVRRERLTRALQRESLSRNALTLSRDPDFWRYLEQIDFAAVDGEIDEVHAKRYIYRTCDITCRRDLDENPHAALQYKTLIIGPFQAWLDAA
ncbi:MAG: hypothetical protein ACE5K1_11710 [Acidiferrobacterales bacterium]